jgi:hypothetical protein
MSLSTADLDKIDALFGEKVIEKLNGSSGALGIRGEFQKTFTTLVNTPGSPVDTLLKAKNDVLSFRTDLLVSELSKLSVIADANLRKLLGDLLQKLNDVYEEKIGGTMTKIQLNFDLLAADIKAILARLKDVAVIALIDRIDDGQEMIRKFSLFIAGKTFFSKAYSELLEIKDTAQLIAKAETAALWNVVSALDANLQTKIKALKSKELEVKNRINLYGEEISYTLNNTAKEIEDTINGELSNLKTDYIVWKSELTNALKELESKAEEQKELILSELSTMPEVAEAQAYIASVNKLVKEEIPLKIKYAEKFVQDQKNEFELNFEKNASKVFAEVAKDSQEILKGKIRQISDEMGGFMNPELATEYLTFLKDPKKIEKELRSQIPADVVDTVDDLVLMGEQASKAYDKFKTLKPKDVFAGLEAKILGAINLKDILGIDFKLPNTTIKDNKLIYHFVTNDLEKKSLGKITFYNQSAKNSKKSKLVVYFERDLKSSNYLSRTKLEDFSLGIWDDSLVVVFNKFEIEYKKGRKNTNVSIAKVGFNGALNFIGQLAEKLKMGGSGLSVDYDFESVTVDYNFAIPSISSPAFNLANLSFGVGMRMPFAAENKIDTLETQFGINSPKNKFLVTVGMFGGRGHFVMRTTPKTLTYLDAALEFGGYYGLNLGIAKGHAFLFAGLRYKIEGTGENQVVGLYAYLICSAGVTVFGFISVSVTFRMELVYRKSSKGEILYGTASVRYSVKIGFFKKSFTLRYKKTFKSKGGVSADPETTALNVYEHDNLYASTNSDPLNYDAVNYVESQSENKTLTDPNKEETSESIQKVFSNKEWDLFLDSYNSFKA